MKISQEERLFGQPAPMRNLSSNHQYCRCNACTTSKVLVLSSSTRAAMQSSNQLTIHPALLQPPKTSSLIPMTSDSEV